jgi:hypothetical protein
MSNFVFPPLPYTKLHSWMFNGLKTVVLPAQSKTDSGAVGRFIDSYLKNQLNITDVSSTVDLEAYGIELKTKDVSTRTDWSIGSMTLEDILTNPYQTSSVYKKLQALLLVDTNDNFRCVTSIGLYYFDIDEVQLLLEESYESARKQLQNEVTKHAQWVASQIANGNTNAILSKVKFKDYVKFHGKYGKFENMNNGSFQFRISTPQMRYLVKLAATQHSPYIV